MKRGSVVISKEVDESGRGKATCTGCHIRANNIIEQTRNVAKIVI